MNFVQSVERSLIVLFSSFQIANNPCANLLTAHFRLDGHPNVNYLEKVIQNAAQSYLFFEPSQVADSIVYSINWVLLSGEQFKQQFCFSLLTRAISIHMFAFASAYVKTKLVDSFVKCVKSSRHVMSRESYFVISSCENSSLLIRNGELIESNGLRQLPNAPHRSTLSRYLMSLNNVIWVVSKSICRKRKKRQRLIVPKMPSASAWYETAFLPTTFSFDIENKLEADMLKFYGTNTDTERRPMWEWEIHVNSTNSLLLVAFARISA